MSVFKFILKNDKEEYDIDFQVDPQKSYEADMTKIEKDLHSEIERVNNIIKSLKHTDREIKYKYFNKLLSLAQAGLVGEIAVPELAAVSLEILEQEILLVEGHRIKNRYMLFLGIGAIVSIVLCWLIYFASIKLFGFPTPAMYFVVWTGAMIGTWISFGARKFVVQLEDLSVLEEDNMYIYIRLPFIGFCALVFLLFINSGILSFKIGGISTENLKINIETQLLLGVLAGLLESKLGVQIYKKAKDMTNNL